MWFYIYFIRNFRLRVKIFKECFDKSIDLGLVSTKIDMFSSCYREREGVNLGKMLEICASLFA